LPNRKSTLFADDNIRILLMTRQLPEGQKFFARLTDCTPAAEFD
jgi:hypothetical protein